MPIKSRTQDRSRTMGAARPIPPGALEPLDDDDGDDDGDDGDDDGDDDDDLFISDRELEITTLVLATLL